MRRAVSMTSRYLSTFTFHSGVGGGGATAGISQQRVKSGAAGRTAGGVGTTVANGAGGRTGVSGETGAAAGFGLTTTGGLGRYIRCCTTRVTSLNQPARFSYSFRCSDAWRATRSR